MKRYTNQGIVPRQCIGEPHRYDSKSAGLHKKGISVLQHAPVGVVPDHEVPPIAHEVLRSAGQPLDANTRAFFEPRFGQDFSLVRIHTNSKAAESAQATNALAYTVGRNVIFGTGQYMPNTQSGRRLLAHELTHVVQQQGAIQDRSNIAEPQERYEQEAEIVEQTLIQEGQRSLPRQLSRSPHEMLNRKGGEIPRAKSESDQSSKIGVQGVSWADLHAPDGHIASIYFATDQAELDEQDRKVLAKVNNAYKPMLALRKVTLLFTGYADYRGTENHNLSLGRRRAEAVANYFAHLQRSLNYSWGVDSAGESEVPQIGSTSGELNLYRRVDIKAYPIITEPPRYTEVELPKTERRSDRWLCRIRATVSGIPGPFALGGSSFYLEVYDPTNNLHMFYRYLGGIIRLAPGISVGTPGVSEGTGWQEFTTSIPIRIQDFRGPARHTSSSLQLKRGPYGERIHLLGPSIHGADSVYLMWSEVWGTGWGLGAGSDIGSLEPQGEPEDAGTLFQSVIRQ